MRALPALALAMLLVGLVPPPPAAAQVPALPALPALPTHLVPTPYGPFEVLPLAWQRGSQTTIVSVPSGYANGGGYADGIASQSLVFHGRIGPSGGCIRDCQGPSTGWFRPATQSAFPPAGYVTEVSVYLDTAWAAAHPDVRFDWSSAIGNNEGSHLRDFVFNAGTDPAGQARFVVSASTNAFRGSSYPSNPDKQPVFLEASGWYALRHVFRDVGGVLVVDMTLRDASGAVVASWQRTAGDPIAGVGGALYGWFANEEVPDLAVDDSWWLPCLGPPEARAPAPVGVHVPAC